MPKGQKNSLEARQRMSLAKRGCIPWNKGKTGVWQEEWLKRNRESQKGKHWSPNTQFKNGQPAWNRGLNKTNPLVKKYSDKLKGRTLSAKTKEKLSLAHLGKKATMEVRRRLSEMRKGFRSCLWRGGITPINRQIRRSFEYNLWRQAVFERDGFTCVWCGQIRGNIEADHIKPFAFFPELRFAIDNGRTLCRSCHRTTDTYGNNYRVYLAETKYK